MKSEPVNINLDRTGGTSHGSGNPPVVPAQGVDHFPEIELLKNDGFSDAETSEAIYVLGRVSFRHLSPYLALVKSKPLGGVPSVKQAHDILTFDRRFQSVIFKYIGIVEAQVRVQYSRRMIRLHGKFALYDANLFLRAENYQRSIRFYESEVKRRAKKSRGIEKLLERNGGRLPIDAGVECATLGTVAQFLANTADREVTEGVARSFGCSKSVLSSWLRTVTDVRNACAHFDAYVVRRQIPSVPVKIADMPGSNNSSAFYVVLLLLRLLSHDKPLDDFDLAYASSMFREVSFLINDFAGFHGDTVAALGIPNDWKEQMVQAAKLYRHDEGLDT